jgi:hypothetical protein
MEISERMLSVGNLVFPEPRDSHSHVVTPDNKKIIIFGGKANSYFNDTWVFGAEGKVVEGR